MFFFLSGYVSIFSLKLGCVDFLKKKIRNLLIPYLFFSFFSFLILRVIFEQNLGFSTFFSELFISQRNHMSFNVALWFLTTLFIIEVVFYFLKRVMRINFIIILLLFILGGFGYITFETLYSPKLPWTIDSAMYYSVFFGIGNILGETNFNVQYRRLMKSLLLCSLAMSMIILIEFNIYQQILFLIHSQIISYIVSIIASLVSIVACIAVSVFLQESKLLRYIGQNSLIILALHIPVGINVLNYFINLFNLQLQLSNNSNLIGLIQTIIILLMMMPTIKVIHKYFPFLLGRVGAFKIKNKMI